VTAASPVSTASHCAAVIRRARPAAVVEARPGPLTNATISSRGPGAASFVTCQALSRWATQLTAGARQIARCRGGSTSVPERPGIPGHQRLLRGNPIAVRPGQAQLALLLITRMRSVMVGRGVVEGVDPPSDLPLRVQGRHVAEPSRNRAVRCMRMPTE
jgi:hypothetical protein